MMADYSPQEFNALINALMGPDASMRNNPQYLYQQQSMPANKLNLSSPNFNIGAENTGTPDVNFNAGMTIPNFLGGNLSLQGDYSPSIKQPGFMARYTSK